MLCTKKPLNTVFSADFALWNISDASVGTEELGHLEMVGTLVHQLTRKLTPEQQRAQGFAPYFVDHTVGVYPQSAGGTPWSAGSIQVVGDPIADLTEDLAADGTTTKEQFDLMGDFLELRWDKTTSNKD